MPKVHAQVTSTRAPEELAATVADFYAVHTWCAWATGTVRDETRPNTRIVTLAGGNRVAEELVDSGPTFVRYRMVPDEANPMKDFEGEIRVVPAADGGSILSWDATFACDAALEGTLGENVRSMYQQGLDDLSAK